ncbi:MAG: hypothetical protein K0R65_2197 [Crocinitomicaceae bacterium]|jgi:hypothetical protein|nr:hypothetical protein [Crocinitomicaceae bacterium]
MFKGRLFLVFLLIALGVFSFYISFIGFRDARFPYSSLLVEKSAVKKITFYDKDPEQGKNQKCILDLSSGKQIVLFEETDNPSREKIKNIRKGDLAVCRYKKTFLQKKMIFSPAELWVSGNKIIDYKLRQQSDLEFARKLLYFAILVSLVSFYLVFAIFYVLRKRKSAEHPKTALWTVGSWLLK